MTIPARPRIVLAYSGGLVSTCAVRWLMDTRGAEVVCVTLDVGQKQDLLQLRDRALDAGAVRAHVVDARHRLARDYVLPALQADALDEHGWPLVEEIIHPLVAETLVEIAELELAGVVAHSAADPSTLSSSMRALAPALEVIRPAQEWEMTPADLAAYARTHGLGLAADDSDSAGSFWGRVTTGEVSSASPANGSRHASADVELAIDRGVPTSINAVPMSLVDLITSLDTIADAHGVGRLVADARMSPSGESRVLEAPAAVVLHAAHRELANETLPPDLLQLLRPLGAAYGSLLMRDLWHSPTREAIDAFVSRAAQQVTGTVRLRLVAGRCTVVEGPRTPVAVEP